MKLQNHLNWERDVGMLAGDSDRSQNFSVRKVPNQPPCNFTAIGGIKKEWGRRG